MFETRNRCFHGLQGFLVPQDPINDGYVDQPGKLTAEPFQNWGSAKKAQCVCESSNFRASAYTAITGTGSSISSTNTRGFATEAWLLINCCPPAPTPAPTLSP